MSIIEKIASAVMKRAVKKYLRLVPSTLLLYIYNPVLSDISEEELNREIDTI